MRETRHHLLIVFILVGSGCQRPTDLPNAEYAGSTSCGSCHEAEVNAWTNSHHDDAMQAATASSVLGDFNNANFVGPGITANFSESDGDYFVLTEGSNGQKDRFRVAYTFGVTPLQQYLIEQPGGRLQALRIAWDSRPRGKGGERWFSLYGQESIEPGDPLHWTGPNQNWNYMCADCHSTDVRKTYDVETDSYQTTWSELDVSCEACHGPASAHVEWANQEENNASRTKANQSSKSTPGERGFAVRLPDATRSTWLLNEQTGNSTLTSEPPGETLINTCARCHSRRGQISDGFTPGDELLDYYQPALLREGLYFSDGQIDDEVYVYGSFVQSKMYAAGVTCTNCHNAHSLELRVEGNALCASCHLSEKYDVESHHQHEQNSEAAQCVTCHMPSKIYMEIDERRDHSFKVPHPAVSVAIGAPDPCSSCHEEKDAVWAQDVINDWFKPDSFADAPAGLVLQGGRMLASGADPELARIGAELSHPAITRATALELLANYGSVFTSRAIEAGLTDQNPLVRLAAVSSSERMDPSTRQQRVFPLLNDPIRAVRIEAARVLAPVELSDPEANALESVILEFISAELTNADRPQAHVNIGLIHLARGRMTEAEGAFQLAIKVDSTSIPARVNLSDLYRLSGQDDRGELVLRKAVSITPESAEAHYALGLNLIRQERRSDAMEFLSMAARFGTYNPRFGYVYGVALHSTGDADAAMGVLEEVHDTFPRNIDVLTALSTISRDMQDVPKAKLYANRLVAVDPTNSVARQLLDQLNDR